MSKKKDSNIEDSKQLGLEIKEPLKNKFFKIKGKFDFALLQFEIRKFLKDPLLWAVLIIGIILILQQVYLIQKEFAELPKLLPIFNYFVSTKNKLVSKEFTYIYPTISISVLLISLFITSRNYNREKSLSKLLMVSALLCVASQNIILIKLLGSF